MLKSSPVNNYCCPKSASSGLQNNLFALRASTSWPSGAGIIYLNCVLSEIETKLNNLGLC
jgi:hypothetical protein